jgi:hypothetical protein
MKMTKVEAVEVSGEQPLDEKPAQGASMETVVQGSPVVEKPPSVDLATNGARNAANVGNTAGEPKLDEATKEATDKKDGDSSKAAQLADETKQAEMGKLAEEIPDSPPAKLVSETAKPVEETKPAVILDLGPDVPLVTVKLVGETTAPDETKPAGKASLEQTVEPADAVQEEVNKNDGSEPADDGNLREETSKDAAQTA